MPEDKLIAETEQAEAEAHRDADVDKAAGLNVNLWTGLAMLLVGAFFLAWAFTRPLSDQLEEESEPAGGRPGGH